MKDLQITSTGNHRIKQVIALDKTSERKINGLFKVEGLREIERCLDKKCSAQSLFYCPDILNEASLNFVKSFEKEKISVTPPVFSKMAYRENKDGLILVAHTPEPLNLPSEMEEKPLIIILENIEKPGNIGAVLRTADAAGVNYVILCNLLTDLYNPNIIRSSLGTCFNSNIIVSNTLDTIAFCKNNNLKILATDLEASERYDLVDYREGLAIVFGAEDKGISNEFRKSATNRIIIPMNGIADSMNISVSCAIVTYEACRQRNFKKN